MEGENNIDAICLGERNPMRTRVSLDKISPEKWLKFDEVLKARGYTVEGAIENLINQTILFGDIPYEPVVYGADCPKPTMAFDGDLARVHPLKRYAIEKIMKSEVPANIHKIVAYGDSVSRTCSKRSPIELAVVGLWTPEWDEENQVWWASGTLKGIGRVDVMPVAPDDWYAVDVPPAIADARENGVTIYENGAE